VSVVANVLSQRRVAVLNAGRPRAPPSEAAEAKQEVSRLVARLGGRVIAAPKDEARRFLLAGPLPSFRRLPLLQ
jgi:hypothetical protein